MRTNRKLRMALANSVVALVFLLEAGAAQAVPNVIREGDTALGILNLMVEGGDPLGYNVVFISDDATSIYGETPVFDWTSNDAAANAVNAINAALDAEAMSADGPIEGVGRFSARLYGVPFEQVGDRSWSGRTGFRSDVDWVLSPRTSENFLNTPGVFADFTVVPEPGTALLLGLGLAGLGVVGRSRRQGTQGTA